jgi:hypothetical protein
VDEGSAMRLGSLLMKADSEERVAHQCCSLTLRVLIAGGMRSA